MYSKLGNKSQHCHANWNESKANGGLTHPQCRDFSLVGLRSPQPRLHARIVASLDVGYINSRAGTADDGK